MTAAPYLDGPWTGETFSPPTPLDIATIEAAIVTQLQAAIGNVVEVIHYPDRPEAYEMRHRIGVAMVIYMGSDYGTILDTAHVAQERTMTFAVGVRIRDLGWSFGGPPSGTSPGAYQILEGIRLALTGFQPNTGCTRMHPTEERFIDRDRQGGVWVYEMHFVTRTMAVEAYQPPTFPLFIHGTAQEEAGVTAIQIAGSLLTVTGSPGVITLPQGNISAVIVQSANLVTTFVVDLDYTIDTVNGVITRAITGSISANATVAVSYAYSDVVIALGSGGNIPFAPNN